MNRDASPSPEPDSQRLSLESLEERLRALPLAPVPEALPSKLIAAIPAGKAAAASGSGLLRRWPWIAAVAVVCITASVAVFSWVMSWSKSPPAASENGRPATSSNADLAQPNSSKAIRDFEEAVHVDPYNADAWFALAKAQAAARRRADAISSAQKAIDIARSRNRADFANTVQAWLRELH
jgi:tetratricopeptide (TPR) repeat protein